VLRGYLQAETTGPVPLRRVAAAHPQTVDAVLGKILHQPQFTWAELGEAGQSAKAGPRLAGG